MARKKAESNGPITISNEERLAAMREVTASKRVVDEAQGTYRALLKRLKAEGIDTKAVIETNAASRQDPAVVQAHEAERLRMLALRRIVSLDEIIDAADQLNVAARARVADDLAAAEEEGYRAGKDGVPTEDCPHELGSEFAVAWLRWHANGVRAAAAAGVNVANASRQREELLDEDGAPTPKRRGRPRRTPTLTAAQIETIADEQHPH